MEEYRPGEWQPHINKVPIVQKVIRNHQDKTWQNQCESGLGDEDKN